MAIKLLSFDIDGTVYDNKTNSKDFANIWNNLRFKNPPLLCYNSGRLNDDVKNQIKQKILPSPDFIISGVGTNIYDYKKNQVLKEFSQILEEGWNLEKVDWVMHNLKLSVTKQPGHFQNEFKSSWFLQNATPEDINFIKARMKKSGLEVNIIYSSSIHLDILPKWANKGNSLEWLLKYLSIKPREVIVAGDSGNDAAMFAIPEINGIVVGNSQPELFEATKDLRVFFTEKTGPEAVFEGLRHFGLTWENFGPPEPENAFIELEHINLMDTNPLIGITPQQIDFIKTGYEMAVKAIKKNITPIGFSACSMNDNDIVGTDENYQSVWARDGSIAIIGTIPLMHDKEIYDCQRHTLETLINNISMNGQIPSNVAINGQSPDYSGVGGICSIDSGLWTIIALHDFIKATKDMDFLRAHMAQLQRIMDWLSAQDGNNDALIEIPEAGDWTDLFGRSYNVLYDEVLWYRVNVCFGRLLELLGNNERAGDYLRWSQIIKQEILLNFWPTLKNKLYKSITFAERQYSLGDTRYLLAQVTPFDFSWRCDIYGNILAYLYDVLDKEKASMAFRFMWGVGVNEPFPVNNVYPSVNPGDPDWRPYYTINLLNLPHHYHNGGIWPFIGGGWVRFINKLGLHELALQELYRLAELNKLGNHEAWEFTEWAHGKTGRPMGKAYQTWSASEYILACHELKIINN
jgi:sucrose-6-phosphatase